MLAIIELACRFYDIDGVPFGPYDYTASQTEYVKNTKGIMTSGGTALYTAMDGKQYGNCYFDIEYASDGLEAGYGITSESLANAYAFIAKNYMTSNKAKLDRTTGSIKLEGPAYVECQGLGSTQRYNMAYYKPSQTTGINSYADWAEQSRYRDFIDYRKQSIVIPLKQTGGISVNYYDIDTGARFRLQRPSLLMSLRISITLRMLSLSTSAPLLPLTRRLIRLR